VHEERLRKPSVAKSGDVRAPASFAQQRLWFLNQLAPESPFYNVPLCLDITGELDVDALRQSVKQLITRHEAFRTVFEASNRNLYQVVTRSQADVALDDLSDQPNARRIRRLADMLSEHALRPFDLSVGPVFRARLVRLHRDRHLFLLGFHHIAADGWSQGILLKELTQLYGGLLAGHEVSQLLPPTSQYRDFSEWQHDFATRDEWREAWRYWLNELQRPAPAARLFGDYPRSAIQSFGGAAQQLRISSDLLEGLKRVAVMEGCSMFMLTLAAFGVLLKRLTGEDAIRVGTPFANRDRPEFESVVGFFANTVLLDVDLAGDPAFTEVMRRVREKTLNALTYQYYPFEHLVRQLKVGHDLSMNPLFQVLFSYDRATSEIRFGDATAELREVPTRTSKFDLGVLFEEGPELTATFEYNTSLFADSTVERWILMFEKILGDVVEQPLRTISAFDVLDDSQRHQLRAWNDTVMAPSKSVIDMFGDQAAARADREAVSSSERSMSYGELDEASDVLANRLTLLGLRREDPVGVLLDRSPEVVVAMIAVLKAGGVYVPLDQSYPEQRIAFAFADCGANLAVTNERLGGLVPDGVHSVVVGGDGSSSQQGDTKPPPSAPVLDQLAYVIYTSGSTGTPKGVAVPHRCLASLIGWYVNRYPPRRTLQFAALGFDASLFEVLSALCSGSTIVVPRDDDRIDPSALWRFVQEHEVERAVLPVRFLPHIARAWTHSGRGLSEVISTGEQLRLPSAVRTAFGASQAPALSNHYGPSETHVVTAYDFARDVSSWPTLPPIGRPIDNTSVFVLDADMNLAPIGAPGELYIGGAGVARGYLRRPGMTAERFVPNPFPREPGERLYRSGDIARHLSDGNVEYLGRVDDQVKIRGFRVEPGEVEVAVTRHAGVQECVVVADEDMTGEARLVAYVVPAEHAVPGDVELRSFLSTTLPEYMVPTVFLEIERIPRTPNGKLDRTELPRPSRHRRMQHQPFVPPSSEVEIRVARIFGSLLGVDNVGVDDDFFELGGHSLLAAQAVASIRDSAGMGLSVRDFFAAPTVRGVAAWLERASAEDRSGRHPPLRRVP
jgi:amino acid adenylation domain-containing protein